MTKSPKKNVDQSPSLSQPEGWHTVRFGDVAKKIRNIVDRRICDLDRFVAGEHMRTDDFRIEEWGTIDDGYLGPAFDHKFSKGQILYGSRRTYLRKVSIPQFDGVCANTTFVIEPTGDDLVPELLPFVMQSAGFNDHSIRMSKGSTNPYISWNDIACYEFAIPDKEQQRRIATTLWAAEDCIVKGERFVAAAERAKQVLMRELFSKGIGHKEFKDVKGYGKLPKEWGLLTLQELIEVIDCKHHTPNYIEKGYPIIRPQNISSGKIDYSDVGFVSEADCNLMNEKHQPKTGDILFSRNASYGVAVYVDTKKVFCIGQDMVIMTQKNADPKYIFQFLCSEFMEKQISKFSMGSTFLRINLADIRQLQIPSAPLPEQRQIAGILARCDETITAARANVGAAKALKMKMINEMLGVGI